MADSRFSLLTENRLITIILNSKYRITDAKHRVAKIINLKSKIP